MRERYYSASWEWECCGGPLRVGDEVALQVQVDSDYARAMGAELAVVLSGSLNGVETHHDEDVVSRRGRVVALDEVIVDMAWLVTPRTTPDPPMRPIGHGVFASVGNAAPGYAEGAPVDGTSRIVPFSAVPNQGAGTDGAEPDLAVFGEQVTARRSGYVITIEVSRGDCSP